LSYKEGAKAVEWECDGSPEFTMQEIEKANRGTDIILYIDEENKNYLEQSEIDTLLKKYCRFLPVPVIFGKEQEWKDGKYVDTDKDKVVNVTDPAWMKKPADLTKEDYLNFYHDLYPGQEDPLFWIHLNVDYPFTLTGILYFPKIKNNFEINKNRIQLYCNQVFVTDSVEGVVPEFLMLLQGVIDSPDIPLNVSRSYLQSDAAVKKISSYITKKVSARLEEIFKSDRVEYESKWDDIKIFIEYGMLTEQKFCESAMKFVMLSNTDGKHFTLDEYKTLIESEQTDKDGNLIYLYATDAIAQYNYINSAKEKGYDEVYYLDIKDMRDNEESEDRDIYLSIYNTIKDKIGNPDKIYAPTVIVLKNGEVTGYNEGTVVSHERVDGTLPPMTDEQKDELREIYRNIF
jgi:molecular chaperone HtpG